MLYEFQEEIYSYGFKYNRKSLPLEEIFTGSNYKSYKHRYYLAQVNENIKPIDKFQEFS